MEDLPTEFDVIVVGTGLAESIVSAAVSRIGKKVLHLDPRDYYGGKWTSLNWSSLESGIFSNGPVLETEDSSVENPDLTYFNPVKNLEHTWYCEDEGKKEQIRNLSRKFNVDVFPKVLQAREAIIELLISSNVSRYLEFKCISKICSNLPAPLEETMETIPLSRSDIFTSKALGLVEKRKLTKFIESVLKEETSAEEHSNVSKTFEQLCQAASLSEKLKHLIESAVKTVEDFYNPSLFNTEFVSRCRLFLQSIGRYGNQTPFLWTLYGVGEICQAFCRLSAIYGGTFILKRSLDAITMCGNDLEVKFGQSTLKSSYVVLGPEIKHESFQAGETRTLVRAVLVTSGSQIKNDIQDGTERDKPNMSVYKIDDLEVIELDYSSLAVPKPFHLIHVTGPFNGQTSPKNFIESSLTSFLDFSGRTPKEESKEDNQKNDDGEKEEEKSSEPQSLPDGESSVSAGLESLEIKSETYLKPVVLYGTYYLIDFYENNKNPQGYSEDMASRILSCATVSTEITGEIKRAQEIFTTMYPEEEFLPRATDGTEESEEAEQNDVEENCTNATDQADFNDNGDSNTMPSTI